MKKIVLKSSIILVLGALISFGVSSCKKEQPTTARITVVDTAGNVFPNAMVRLYPTPSITSSKTIIIDDTLSTGPDGECVFDYTEMFNLGTAGFAVLDIEVWNAEKTLSGEGIIKIVEEETNEETVIIQAP